MNIRFENDYSIELYTQGKTTDMEFREIASETEPPIIEICSLVDITNHYK